LHVDCQEIARKRCSERRRKYEKPCVKREFAGERKQEQYTGQEISFFDAEQRTEDEPGVEKTRQSL